MSLILISLAIRIFSNLISRCTKFFECKQANALRISFIIILALTQVALLLGCALRYQINELFSTSYIIIFIDQLVYIVQQYFMILGWEIDSITFIQLRILFMWEGSEIFYLSQIFIAQTPPFHDFTNRTDAYEPLPMTPPTLQEPISQEFRLAIFCQDFIRYSLCDDVCFIILLFIFGSNSGFYYSVSVVSWEVNLGRILFRFLEFYLSFSKLRNFFCRSSSSQRLVFRIVFFKFGSFTGLPNSIPNAPLPLVYQVLRCGSNFTLSNSQPFSINNKLHILQIDKQKKQQNKGPLQQLTLLQQRNQLKKVRQVSMSEWLRRQTRNLLGFPAQVQILLLTFFLSFVFFMLWAPCPVLCFRLYLYQCIEYNLFVYYFSVLFLICGKYHSICTIKD